MNTQTAMVDLFKEKAKLVSAVVSEVSTYKEAFEYCVDLCDRKEACQLLISGCEQPLSAKAEDLCDEKQQKIIAAPGLKESHVTELNHLAAAKDIQLITEDLRKHLAGIDMSLTFIDYGIAETGTLVLDSSSEEVRLATMISEVHIALLPESKIRQNAYALEEELKINMLSYPNYTAFITGPSRTADIERVLALGVHGPLELHILLLKDK